MFGTTLLEKTVHHRVEILDEIESTAQKLSEDLSQETVDLLKKKVDELEETNRQLEKKKQEYKLEKKCFKCTRITGLHWVIGSFFVVSLALFIARFVLTYAKTDPAPPSNCTATNESKAIIVGNVLDVLLLVSGGLAFVQQAWLSSDENNLRALNDASVIEKFGEESYQRFLQALEQLKMHQSQKDLKNCIHTLDELPNHPLAKEKLIPKLLNMLPDDNEIVIKFSQIKEDGRRLHVEITATEPDRFEGEKKPFKAISHPELSPLSRFQQKWEEFEDALETKFDRLECNDTIYQKNGLTEQLHTMVPISLEDEFIEGMIEI